MEKTITLKLKDAIFLHDLVAGVVKASTEEDLIKKIKFFEATKAIKEEKNKFRVMPKEEGEAAAALVAEDERTFQMDSESLDWLKSKWKTVPAEYKLSDPRTGEVVQVGFTGESDCQSYYDAKVAMEDARVVKEGE